MIFSFKKIFYATAFSKHKPARATVAAAGLPMNVLVEIDCVALA